MAGILIIGWFAVLVISLKGAEFLLRKANML